jgi:hypothetical protein
MRSFLKFGYPYGLIGAGSLIAIGSAAFHRPTMRFGLAMLGWSLCVLAAHGISRRLVARGILPLPQRVRRRRQGVWADPPVAELDKSTVGLLLASRLRREPGLRVVAPGQGRDWPAPPSDGLWDRELDG